MGRSLCGDPASSPSRARRPVGYFDTWNRAGQLAKRLADVAEDYAISRIGQLSRRKRLRETADRLAHLAGADMPGAVLALKGSLSALRGESPPATRPQEDR